MSALIFLVISAWGGGNLFSFLSQLAYNSGFYLNLSLSFLYRIELSTEDSSRGL